MLVSVKLKYQLSKVQSKNYKYNLGLGGKRYFSRKL